MGWQLQVSNWPEGGDPWGQPTPIKLQPGDAVLVWNHVGGPFGPKCVGDCRVVSLGGNQVEVQPAVGGPAGMGHVEHVECILPTDRCIDQLPDCSGFGGRMALGVDPNQVLGLHWKLAGACRTTNIGQSEMGNTSISIHDITVKTSDAMCKTSLNTETCTTQSRCEPIVCSIIPIT